MDETKKDNPSSNPSTTRLGQTAQGSGSDTVSAAKISAGSSVGSVGSTPMPGGPTPGGSAQSTTLASHTSRPLGGTPGGTGVSPAHAHSAGPEHNRHQDKDAGQGLGHQSHQGQSGGASAASGGGVGDTAEQVRERVGEAYEQATEWARDTYKQASEWASDRYEQGSRQFSGGHRRAMRGAGGARQGVERFVAENPVLVGVVGLAAGLLLGALLPRTRQEDRTFGRWADEVREQGYRYARDMTHRGRDYVEQAFNEEDPRFASHESEWRQDEQGSQQPRPGPSGRYQNH